MISVSCRPKGELGSTEGTTASGSHGRQTSNASPHMSMARPCLDEGEDQGESEGEGEGEGDISMARLYLVGFGRV